MAKVAAAATKAKPKAAPVKGKPTRAVASVDQDDDELSALAGANKNYEDAERAKTGSQNSFITLLQRNSNILVPDDPAYIKGAKANDYVIASKKLRLGAELDVTILGMFKLYAETTKKENDNEMAATVGFWMPEDAAQFPVEGIFDRPLPNGNILRPVHWVFCYLHDYPDVTDGLIAFRSTGNKIYSDLFKFVKESSSLCTELRFKVTNQPIRNEAFKTTYYYPKFDLVGKNYEYLDEKVTPLKGGLDKATLKEVLARSNEVQKNYAEMKLVAKKNDLARIAGGSARAALPPGKGEEYEDVPEEAGVQF